MHKDLKLYKEKVLKMEYGFDYILNQATKEGTFRVRPCQVTRTDRLSMSAWVFRILNALLANASAKNNSNGQYVEDIGLLL